MKKLLFSVCAVLAILGCGGENVDELPPFKDRVGIVSSGGDNSSSSGGCPNPYLSGKSMSCGGQSYRTVNINGRVWMAENLNYTPDTGTSDCYGSNSANCIKYGRLYDWSTAKTVCPAGWHLPSDEEWTALIDFVESYSGCSSCAGVELKSETGWYYNYGEDTHGFSALPGGYGISDSVFSYISEYGSWWSSTELKKASNTAYSYIMYYSYSGVYSYYDDKSSLLSVRCVQNSP